MIPKCNSSIDYLRQQRRLGLCLLLVIVRLCVLVFEINQKALNRYTLDVRSSLILFALEQLYTGMEGFYRATLCVRAVFAVAKCLSVPLSVRHVGGLYPHGWRYRVTSCSARRPHHYDPWAFQKEPRQRGREVHMWAKFANFDRNRRLSRKRYEIGPWSLWNVNRKS